MVSYKITRIFRNIKFIVRLSLILFAIAIGKQLIGMQMTDLFHPTMYTTKESIFVMRSSISQLLNFSINVDQ